VTRKGICPIDHWYGARRKQQRGVERTLLTVSYGDRDDDNTPPLLHLLLALADVTCQGISDWEQEDPYWEMVDEIQIRCR
jgi:hypothetical protein